MYSRIPYPFSSLLALFLYPKNIVPRNKYTQLSRIPLRVIIFLANSSSSPITDDSTSRVQSTWNVGLSASIRQQLIYHADNSTRSFGEQKFQRSKTCRNRINCINRLVPYSRLHATMLNFLHCKSRALKARDCQAFKEITESGASFILAK